VRQVAFGLVLTAAVGAVGWWRGGETAAVGGLAAGLLATAIEATALRVLTPALVPPFERLMKRWAIGFGLRLAGLATVVTAVVLRPGWFPALPTALGFMAVLIPLLLGEMWVVSRNLRTTR